MLAVAESARFGVGAEGFSGISAESPGVDGGGKGVGKMDLEGRYKR